MAARAHRFHISATISRIRSPNLLLPPPPTAGGRLRRGNRFPLISGRMASGDSRVPASLASIALPGGDTVEVVAAPGVSDSDLRLAHPFRDPLFLVDALLFVGFNAFILFVVFFTFLSAEMLSTLSSLSSG